MILLPPVLSNWTYNSLIDGFEKGQRFNIPARGPAFQQVLDELALSASDLADPDTAQRVGLLVGADAILQLQITSWRNDELEVRTRLINTETGKYIFTGIEADVFMKEPGAEFLRNTVRDKMQFLADRYALAFPLLKGEVVEVRGDNVYTNVGRVDGLKECMKFYVYRELDVITNLDTGESICIDADILSQAAVNRLFETGSRAEVLNKDVLEQIEPRDAVMTK